MHSIKWNFLSIFLEGYTVLEGFILLFETGCHYVAQGSLAFIIIQPQPPNDDIVCVCVPPHSVVGGGCP